MAKAGHCQSFDTQVFSLGELKIATAICLNSYARGYTAASSGQCCSSLL